MALQKNLNVSPYYDDFDPNKNFYKVLYKAGFPVQARELTTQQSILQDQVEKFASRILKEGDNVVPGEYGVANPIPYARLATLTQGATAEDFIGYTVTGVTSGVTAFVNFALNATEDDDATFYVNYISSGATAEHETFIQGEVLESDTPNRLTATVGVDGISKPTSSSALGQGSLFTVSEGSYFINGFSVRNDADTIPLEKYNTRPTYRVGFVVTEEVVTANEDPSLLDNSQGSSNFAAPGADRLKISLTLAARGQDNTDPNFIVLCNIQNGEVLGKPGETVKWEWLYDLLAKRTYDESGDYIVKDFEIKPYEYFNNADVDGLFEPDEENTYPPVPGSDSTERLTVAQADAKYAIRVSPGEAYVQGYSCGTRNPQYIYSDKSRDVEFRSNSLTQITDGYNLTITNVSGAPDFANIIGDGTAKAYDEILLYRNFVDGYVGESEDGTGRPLNLGNKPWTTYHIICDQDISGSTGYSEVYKQGNSAVLQSNSVIRRGDVIGGATVLISTEIKARPAGVMRPRYMTGSQLLAGSDGYYAYNSTYKLGIMASQFFTEINVIGVTNPQLDWTVGDVVTGEISGARGLVETGSTATSLLLSNVIGEFEAGEDITQGDKASRIYRDGEVARFEFVDKGTNNNTVDLSAETAITIRAIGTETELTVADSEISVSADRIELLDAGREKLRNFPYPEGSALNQRINYEIETVAGGVKGYSVSLTPIITNTLTLAKSFHSELADTNDFSADISAQNNVDAEVVDVANASLFSGDARTNSITCDNFSGDPTQSLIAGDLVTFVDDQGLSINKVVANVTKPIGYGSLRSKATIYFTTAIPNSVTGKTVQRIRVRSQGKPEQTLLFQLPQDVVSSLESDPRETRINYQVLREFLVTVQAGSSTVTLASGKTNESFIANDRLTSMTVAENLTDPTDPSRLEGRLMTFSSIDVSQDEGKKVVFNLNKTLPASVTMKVIVPVFVTNATAKRKTFVQNHEIEIPADVAAAQGISLGIADVYNVQSIIMGTADVTDNYILNNGQRDNYYDIASIRLKVGRPAATEALKVTVNYFEHSDEGDFFSVDSYTSEEGIGFKLIPYFSPTGLIPKNSEQINNTFIALRDAIDFRPIVNTAGLTPSVIAAVTPGVDEQGSTNFTESNQGGNAFVPRLPISGTQFQCDLEFFLPRFDSLFIDSTGALSLQKGTPSESPAPPADLSAAIRLYDIFLPAYTFAAANIKINKFNYKRYRMKDIQNIDSRIERLEELVTLSLLEQAALNVSVRDAVTGLDRFKNGIVVDSFRDHSRGDVGNSQYRNSVDNKNSHLRPPFFKDQVELEEIHQTDADRFADGYALNNGILTVAYESTRFAQNPLATRFINLQPYTVFTFDGSLELNPSVDTFEDITRLPDLVVENNHLYDAMVNLTGEMKDAGFGTQWSDWETTGSNTSRTNSTTIRNNENNPNATQQALIAAQVQGIDINFTQWSQDVIDRGGAPPIRIDTMTTRETQQRTQTQTSINVSTGRIDNTSYGDRVVDVQLARTMRTIPVYFQAYRLKPNTRYYAFFDDIEVTDWCSIDNTTNDFPDGHNRYSGVPNGNPKGFGFELVSDDVGTMTGVFLVPNGYAPVAGQVFSDLSSVSYRTDGTHRQFTTGQRTLRFTSHPLNEKDESQIEGFAEAEFMSSGVLVDKQETIVSTRVPAFSNSTETIATDTRVIESQEQVANYFDPVAQTFLVDENNAEGIFVTELDIFFKTKDSTQGVEAYLVSTDGQVPTEKVLPHSFVTKNTDTILRMTCSLDSITSTLPAGTTIVGQTSGATGTLKSAVTFATESDNPTTNVANTVYNVILNNYNGVEFVAGEEIIPELSPVSQDSFFIANDEFDISRVDLKTLGSNYTGTASLVFSEPSLPGGVRATGTCLVDKGIVYRVDLTDKGSGYTAVPTVSINDDTIDGTGAGATALVRVVPGRKAVDMGICTSEDATAGTKFRFKAPVYLMGDTYYAFVVKAPTSLNFNIYTSKLGENQLGTELRVVDQANLGSLFMSQNGGLWTEDQTQDVTFRLWRADFQTGATAIVGLNNAPLVDKVINADPIETSNVAGDPESTLFGDNPTIVRIYHNAHGHAPGDYVAIRGVDSTPGGIPNEEINAIHRVIDVGFNTFTIQVTTAATESSKSGGNDVRCSFNRPYEVVNIAAGAMAFSTSGLQTTNRTTQHAGITGYNQYNAYTLDKAHNIRLIESYYYGGAKQVAGYLNEADHTSDLRGGRSLQTNVFMTTANPKVSPVLDLQRTNSTIVRSIVDNPQKTDAMYGSEVKTVTFIGDLAAVGLEVGDLVAIDDDGTPRNVIVKEVNNVTKKVRIGGQYAYLVDAQTQFIDEALNAVGILNVTTTGSSAFIPETNNDGSVFAKWISRLFLFENTCDGIQLKLTCIFYDNEDIKVYYRPRNIGFDGEIASTNWIPFNGTGLADDIEAITPRSSDSVDPNLLVSSDWQNLTWSVQDLQRFDGVQVKVVMTSNNPAQAPLIDDLQVIVSE